MSAVVPARMELKLVGKLDELVKSGRYVSRSDAVRDAVRELVTRYGASDLSATYQAYARVVASSLAQVFRGEVSDIILYGSVAEGGAGEDSDIDLLILARGDPFKLTSEMISFLYPMELQLSVLFSINVYRREDFIDALEKGFLFERRVLQSGIPLYGGLVSELRAREAPPKGARKAELR